MATKEDEHRTYSIALRIRRITYEDAYVAVPVTDAILKMDEAGETKIDFERFVTAAIALGADPDVEWKVESTSADAHPSQGPLPEGRRSFDPMVAERRK